MEVRAIKSKRQHQEYLNWANEQIENNVSPTSKNGKLLEVVLILIKHYEDIHFPIPERDSSISKRSRSKGRKLNHENLSRPITS